MRSPNDADDESTKMIYQGHLFEDDLNTYISEDKAKGSLKKWFLKGFNKSFFWKRKIPKKEDLDHKRVYSFTELELSKIKVSEMKEMSSQTGESLEKAYIQKIIKEDISKSTKISKGNKGPKNNEKDKRLPDQDQTIQKKLADELEMIRYFKASKSDSFEIKPQPNPPLHEDEISRVEELELYNTEYEKEYHSIKSVVQKLPQQPPDSTTYEIESEVPETSNQTRKRLRFAEGATTIPDYNEEEVETSPSVRRRSVFIGPSRTWREDLESETGQEDETQSSSAPMDFMRFWGNSKTSKKSKKKPRTH